MKIINYISIIAMPMVIFIIISEALKERKNVFDIFILFQPTKFLFKLIALISKDNINRFLVNCNFL